MDWEWALVREWALPVNAEQGSGADVSAEFLFFTA